MSLGCLPALLRWNSFRFSALISFHSNRSDPSRPLNNVSPSSVSPLFQLSNSFALAALSNIVFNRVRLMHLVAHSHVCVGIQMRDVFWYMFFLLSTCYDSTNVYAGYWYSNSFFFSLYSGVLNPFVSSTISLPSLLYTKSATYIIGRIFFP